MVKYTDKKPYMINIEGIDGSGKETTSKTLMKLLTDKGYKVKVVSYPQYEKWHSFLVRLYLKGVFGKNPSKVNPYLASLFYAIDRFFHWHFYLKRESKNYDFIIFDRYTASNMIHQAAKRYYDGQAIKVAKVIRNIENKILRIPEPHLIVILNIPTEKAIEAMKFRKSKDIHESSIKYLENCSKTINLLVSLRYTFYWYNIETYKPGSDERYTPEEISEMIYGFINYKYL